MPCCANDGEENEEASSADVCPAQEGVLSSYPRDGRNDDGLGALVGGDGEV